MSNLPDVAHAPQTLVSTPCLAVCFLSLAFAQPVPTVNVTGGAVRGYLAAPGAVFKAIPFASPPVGALRWREPQPVKPWRGVRDATRYPAACVQNPIGTGVFIGPLARRYGASFPAPHWDLSEDCLYLNVWTPEWPAKESRAVMFWMHGGSNRIGSGNEPGYAGAELAKRGVVVVTINYRLGPLGFFAHPELTRESPHRSSGNYGLLDQIAALQWVRDNIAKFGGDPSRVTVFGESAGSVDAGMLMCSPLAGGLFARVIMESAARCWAWPMRTAFGKRSSSASGLPSWRCGRSRAIPPAIPPSSVCAGSPRKPSWPLRPQPPNRNRIPNLCWMAGSSRAPRKRCSPPGPSNRSL